MNRRFSIIALLLIAASLGACYETSYDKAIAALNAGAPPPPPPPPTPPTPPPPPPPPPPTGFGPNFSEIQASVFTPNCATSGCHAGANPRANLNLDAANSYTMLVGVASTQDGGTQRVRPSEADDSYLIEKLEGPGASGGQMPPSGAMLQADINTIRQWISAGAVDDRNPPPPQSAPIKVLSLSVTPGGTLNAAPTQIIAGFDRALDVSTVNLNTFILEDSNNAGITADSITVAGANNQSAIFDLTGVALVDDTYTVRLLGSGASFIMDLDANALDGEFTGGFPSGNNTEGGDFVVQFILDTQVAVPTLDEIQAAIFTPSCATAGCHSNGNQAAGLALGDADTSYAEMVGEFSNQIGQSGVMLVAPTDPNASYLIRKLENTGITGARMPLNAGALPQSEIDQIRDWITAGAAR